MEKDIEGIRKIIYEFIEKYGYTVDIYTSADGRCNDGSVINPRISIQLGK